MGCPIAIATGASEFELNQSGIETYNRYNAFSYDWRYSFELNQSGIETPSVIKLNVPSLFIVWIEPKWNWDSFWNTSLLKFCVASLNWTKVELRPTQRMFGGCLTTKQFELNQSGIETLFCFPAWDINFVFVVWIEPKWNWDSSSDSYWYFIFLNVWIEPKWNWDTILT